MARARDLGRQLHLVTRLVLGRAVGPESDHAPGKAGQVTHLMLQEAPFPFRDVGEAAARPPDQTRLDGLGTGGKTWREMKSRIQITMRRDARVLSLCGVMSLQSNSHRVGGCPFGRFLSFPNTEGNLKAG